MTTSFHLYLRTDKQKKNGEYPLYLRITHNRKHRYISTGVSILEKHWNEDKEIIRKSHRNSSVLNEILKNKIDEAQKAQSELSKTGKESAKSIKERLHTSQKADFFEIGDQLLKDLEKSKKLFAIKNTKVVLKKLERFEGERSLPLKKMDTTYLEKFERFLKTEYDNSDTTINKNFEVLRKGIRMAVSSHLMSEDPFLHFNGVKRKPPKEKTKLSMDQIKTIEELNLKTSSWLWDTRNAFLFSFYSGGIRFGDVCCLKWANVKNGRLSYQMNKNQKTFSTELNKFQLDILALYSGNVNEYIFPFLSKDKDLSDPMELRRDIGSKNVVINKNLKILAKLVNKKLKKETSTNIPQIEGTLSFHVSRHSFAQHAVESGLDVYELMQTLRHSKLETTQKYLKSLDGELADKAMKKVF